MSDPQLPSSSPTTPAAARSPHERRFPIRVGTAVAIVVAVTTGGVGYAIGRLTAPTGATAMPGMRNTAIGSQPSTTTPPPTASTPTTTPTSTTLSPGDVIGQQAGRA